MELSREMGRPLTKARKLKIANLALKRQIKMDALITLFLGGDYRVTQNAARVLSSVAEKDPGLLSPYLKILVARAARKDARDPVKRNVLRILQYTPLPIPLHDIIGEFSSRMFENRREAVAIRVFAMTILVRLSEFYPDMKRSLSEQIADELPFGSAGFISRGRGLLKKLKSGNAAEP